MTFMLRLTLFRFNLDRETRVNAYSLVKQGLVPRLSAAI